MIRSESCALFRIGCPVTQSGIHNAQRIPDRITADLAGVPHKYIGLFRAVVRYVKAECSLTVHVDSI